MNLPKSSRYHRAKRRADAAAVGISVLLLTGLLATRAAVSLRDAVGGSAAAYAVVLLALIGGATLPLDWYRGYRLEREYGLSQIRGREWVSDRLKAAVITLAA